MNALDALPTFADLAQSAISRAGERDKTITIKIALPTARMMVEAEGANALLSAKFEIIRLAAANKALIEAAGHAQCGCSVAERDSGHRTECWMPALSETIADARGDA